jgi:Ni/Fe-hydrogenase subunit HybB-like protein
VPANHNVPNPNGYADRTITKAPSWHTLVVFDVLFNNLATGLFLVAATAELAAPATFTTLATVAYPIALVLLLTDLALLVLDLGDPLRFHHMLRVFKPSSPMSLGTWCLTVFSVFLTVIVVVEICVAAGWFPDDAGLAWWARKLAIVGGLPFAFGSAAYKGVLFSTTSQPGWRDARWMGGYFTNSALMLGCAALLVLSIVTGQAGTTPDLRIALMVAVLLNAVTLGLLVNDVRATLAMVYSRETLRRLGALRVSGGLLLPLALLAVDRPLPSVVAALLIVLGAWAVRREVVHFPHRQTGHA